MSTTQIIGGGLGTIASYDPEPISGAILNVASKVVGVFTAAHQAALKKEASTINAALPTYIYNVRQVIDAANQGALDQNQAIGYLQDAEAIYYETVKDIQKGHWPYTGQEYPEPTWSDSYADRTGPYGTGDRNPDSHAPDPCNAACVTGHYFVERTTFGLIQAVQNGGGSVVIEAFPNNGMIKGIPAQVITYSPSVLSSILPFGISQAIPSFLKNNWIIAGVVIIFIGLGMSWGRK